MRLTAADFDRFGRGIVWSWRADGARTPDEFRLYMTIAQRAFAPFTDEQFWTLAFAFTVTEYATDEPN